MQVSQMQRHAALHAADTQVAAMKAVVAPNA